MIDGEKKRKKAQALHDRGYKPAEISRMLDVKVNTINSWKRRYGWETKAGTDAVKRVVEQKLIKIWEKPGLTDADYKEIDKLNAQLDRCVKRENYKQSGKESDINDKVKNRKTKKTNQQKNGLTEEEFQLVKQTYLDGKFGYQQTWWDNRHQRTRFILKSRQIGATYDIAMEAYIDACETGDNQIFCSASKNQAEIFRDNIINFVRNVTGVELKGNPLVLPNGATLYFLGTNIKTAQGYSGNVYIDEAFWINNFETYARVTKAMATLKHLRRTFMSTPSSKSHEAYPMWDGSHYNKGRNSDDHIQVDTSETYLRNGRVGKDGTWRHTVTLKQAIKTGNNLISYIQIEGETNPYDFKNLYLCKFIDDRNSVFSLKQLLNAKMNDDMMGDYEVGEVPMLWGKPVWVGYDPSRSIDEASLVVVAPPHGNQKYYRAVEKHSYSNLTFDEQAKKIKQICERYNVQYLGIDTTGIGVAVYDLVRKFYPSATPIHYTPEVKSDMVHKAQQLFKNKMFKYPADWNDLAAAFMTIYRTSSDAGGKIVYKSRRTGQTGHADVAWATMHAISNMGMGDINDQQIHQGRTKQATVIIQ